MTVGGAFLLFAVRMPITLWKEALVNALRCSWLTSLLALVFVAVVTDVTIAAEAKKPNILFIAIDDLRPQLGCYGQTQMKTPNLDRLAASGTLFTRTYCQVSVCGASRASLLTGMRPTAKRFRNYRSRADRDVPGIVTLPQHFKNNGYHTRALGEIFHFSDDSAGGWSEPHWRSPDAWPGYHLQATKDQAKREHRRNRHVFGPPWEFADCEDNGYPDGRTAEQAVKDLSRLKQLDKPFFMAVGFVKPHLPFTAPKKYWDMYDHAKIPLAANPYPPKGAPRQSLHKSAELRGNFSGMPHKGKMPDKISRNLVHAYYACTSFADAQVGKLLDELDKLKIADETIVIVWGDHGWQLGEHGLWAKHCVYHTSMHSPMILRVPGQKGGVRCHALTEFVDIYPTLCDLAGHKQPEHLEGLSFKPLLADPKRPWKKAIYGNYGGGWAVRDDRYTYSEFRSRGRTVARMLYDHDKDPNENVNIVSDPASAGVVKKLSALLIDGWTAALPEGVETVRSKKLKISAGG